MKSTTVRTSSEGDCASAATRAFRGQLLDLPVVLGSRRPREFAAHAAQVPFQHCNCRSPGSAHRRVSLLTCAPTPFHEWGRPVLQHCRHPFMPDRRCFVPQSARVSPTSLPECSWIALGYCDARSPCIKRGGCASITAARAPLPEPLPRCGYEVHPLGQARSRRGDAGREFPDAPVERFDPMAARAAGPGRHDPRAHRQRLIRGARDVAKGPHFPDVTLVSAHAAQSLFRTDYRAAAAGPDIGRWQAGPGAPTNPAMCVRPCIPTSCWDPGRDGYAGSLPGAGEAGGAQWPPPSRMALSASS